MTETKIRERPILFSGPIVRAILEGRKTQTRRVLKVPKWGKAQSLEFDDGKPQVICVNTGCFSDIVCPYGQPGDRLWVREAFAQDTEGEFYYRADEEEWKPRLPWRPSIFMPRKASRISLEVEEVRVERLQEISYEDILAEGIRHPEYHSNSVGSRWSLPNVMWPELWDSINAKRGFGWKKNPWVWVIVFREV